MKKVALVALTLALMTGCSEIVGSDGRYQAVAASEYRVWINDTKTGKVAICKTRQLGGEFQIECSPQSEGF